MNSLTEKLVSVVLGATALTIASVEVHKEFFRSPASPTPQRQSSYVSEWRSIVRRATVTGETAAPVQVIVFTDFQCPFCRKFNTALAVARREHPNAIATAVIHLPLAGHLAADPAARAAECAGRSARFSQAVDFLYDKQDSLGKLPWSTVARATGIADTTGFVKCMDDSVVVKRVRDDAAFAMEQGINATPTVIVNGWRYGVPPSDTELVRAIGDILKGKKPYKDFSKEGLAPPAR